MAESPSLVRTRFLAGQLLTAEDLTREQDYSREKLKRHNRILHGFGVVSGLRVNITRGKVGVEPGLALDCEGNEIVVGTAQQLSTTADARIVYVNIRYSEEKSDSESADGTIDTSVMQAATITESFEICFGQENYARGHRHLRARWLACGEAHPLTIAKLRYNSQGWRLDRRYRAPVIK